MRMLFTEDYLQDLQSQGDVFDGSEEEIKIFQGFFNNIGVESLPQPGTGTGTTTISCRIVQSSEHGDLSTYTICCVLPCSTPRLVSQDNTGKLLLPVPTTPPSSPTGTLDISNIDNSSLTDLCTHLHAHASRLFTHCGYKVELQRTKTDPQRFNYLYQLPNGGPALSHHLPETWVSLGKLLQSSLTGSALDKTRLSGRQWLDLNEFASDLQKTLTYVEKLLQNPDCELTLSDQWFLLDPFMAVAWIDHKIEELRKAVPVQAVQSRTSVLQENVADPVTYSRRKCKKTLLPLLGEGVLSASDLRKGPCITGEERQSANRLHARPVTTCTTDFHATPEKLREVLPITTGEEAQGTTQLHVSQVTNGEEVSIRKHSCANPVSLPDNIPFNTVSINR